MKRLLLILLLNQTAYFCFAQDNPDSLIRVLKIKTVNIFEAGRLAGTRTYDSDGYLIYHTNDNFVGGPIRTTLTIIYDNNHNKAETKLTHSSFPRDTTCWLYKYDSSKNLLSIEEGYKKRLIFKYIYDSLNRNIKQIQFDEFGNISLEESYKYNNQELVMERQFNGQYFKNRLSKSYYDVLNREIKSETIDNDKIIITTLTEYEGDLNRKSKTIYQEDEGVTGIAYKYDRKGRLIKRVHFIGSENQVTGFEEFTYFDNDLIKTYSNNIFSFSLKKRIFIYKYE